MPSLADLEAAAAIVYGSMPATPAGAGGRCSMRGTAPASGSSTENQHAGRRLQGPRRASSTSTIFQSRPDAPGHRHRHPGNHGQSPRFAARRYGRRHRGVPFGDGLKKNLTMQALGAELIQRGTIPGVDRGGRCDCRQHGFALHADRSTAARTCGRVLLPGAAARAPNLDPLRADRPRVPDLRGKFARATPRPDHGHASASVSERLLRPTRARSRRSGWYRTTRRPVLPIA